MKKSKYLMLIFFVTILLFMPNMVNAECGDLIYEITKLNVNDEKITFEGWAFIHFTNNSKNEKVYNSVRYGGGQEVMIVAENTNTGEKKYLKNKLYTGYSGTNADKLKEYNFYYMQFYDKKNTRVETEYTTNYNHLTGRYDANSCEHTDKSCPAKEECHQCLYEDIGFHIETNISDLNMTQTSTYKFYIYATNNNYNEKYNNNTCKGTDLNKLKGKINPIKYDNKTWAGSEIYISEAVKSGSSKMIKIHNNAISKNRVYVTVEHGMPRVLKDNIYSSITSYINHDEFIYSNRIEDNDCFHTSYKCGPGDYVIKVNEKGTSPGDYTTAKIYRSWAVPAGTTTLTIDFETIKKCPIDIGKSTPLSCNNTKNLVSECNELTVTSGNESTTVSVKQTGILANLLSPTEIYNGGGIKFGLIYYNRVEFNYVSGSHNIALSDVMNGRITNDENINLENVKIGNINVDSSYIKKECNQIKGNNYVDTICLFHFKPQIVNEDGTITKDDVDLKYDQGINNKYYLPLDYTPVYRVSASLMNASILSKEQAKKDGENNKVWYGNKWDEIKLSNDGSCDINVYKLGPGSNNGSDSNEDGGQTPSKIIYKFIYRPIDLNNPFPGRIPGLNWYNWYNNNPDKLKEAYNSLQYNIELNNIIINKIKNYNSSKNYFNFDYDNFINETGLKVGGNE